MSEMQNEYKVLDHGYVKLVTWWGTDARIIEGARMSTQGAFRGWGPFHEDHCPAKNPAPYREGGPIGVMCDCNAKPGDEKLLRYLYEHNHMSPFEMAGMQIEVQAPIFVFREWHRHRTQSYNEASARYAPLPDVNYIPTLDRIMVKSEKNKQAGTIADAGELTPFIAEHWVEALDEFYTDAQHMYQSALSKGIPKELARLVLPVGRYSRMRAQATLRNWLQFLSLRDHPAAQWEIQQYAKAVGSLLKDLFPRTYELFDQHR